MASVFASPPVQAGVVAVLSGIALWAGRFIYLRAHARHEEVAEQVSGRKRPRIKDVLYEIFWLPLILLGMVWFVRLGVMVLPRTVVVDVTLFVLDRLVVLVFVLVSINVVREVVRAAGGGEDDVIPEEKEG